MPDLKYPIGEFDRHAPITSEARLSAIDAIDALPHHIRQAVEGLNDAQLDTPYRPGGWTVRQLVHHVADSHMNGLIRVKLALTETNPTIKPYDQNLWATLPDMRLPIDASLRVLDGVHERWTMLYMSIDVRDLARTFYHPEMGSLSLDGHLQLYGWHSQHHVAHITELRRREGW